MPKIKKDTTKYLKSCNSLKIFKYEKSKKYYACFYVGINASTSGNKIITLKTENINEASKVAKEKYHEWFENHRDDFKSKDFTNDIANPYFKFRIRKYKDNGKKENQGVREKQKYFNYMIKYFEKIDYKNNEQLTAAIEDMVENLRMDNKTDNTISKFTTVLSNMFNYAIKNLVMKSRPDFPMLKIINNARPSYFNNELNMISKRLTAEYEKTKDKFYLETKDYINLIRSAGFRPGLEPLRIKKFQYRFIKDKKAKEQILVFTLFNTKTKPKHQLTCHPYFTKYIFPEIVNRNPNTNADTYLLFPNYQNRQKVYNRIVKIFTRLSKELHLYYRNGLTRPIYSIRHTYIKNRYAENPQSLEVIARQSNTSPKMIHRNYLDEDDIMMVEEYRKMYPNKSSKN
jgi:hypothetical protein